MKIDWCGNVSLIKAFDSLLLRHSIVYCDGRDYRSDDSGDWREPIPENFCVRFD